MKTLLPGILILLFITLFTDQSCAADSAGIAVSREQLCEQYRKKAVAYEMSNELRKAIYCLNIVNKLNSGDRKTAAKLSILKKMAEETADRHCSRGVTFYMSNSYKAARKEFVTALRYDPNHKKSLDYLKNRLMGNNSIAYKVKAGDSFKTIAKTIYKNGNKGFLVAYFSGQNLKTKPIPGLTLRLPVLKEIEAKEKTNTPETLIKVKESANFEKDLIKAKRQLKSKNYEAVLSIVLQIPKGVPEKKEAAKLANISYFNMGKELSRKNRYVESLNMYNMVDPGFKGIQAAKSSVKRKIKKEAERHYRVGVKYFINEELEKAIGAWTITLTLNPGHKMAEKNIEISQRLIEKLGKIQ